jgi:hypothetical protein
LAFEPLWIGTDLKTDSLGFHMDSLQVTRTAFGGYWTLRFNLASHSDCFRRILDVALQPRGSAIENRRLDRGWTGATHRTI